jgi:hypothetical protein
MVNNWVNRLKWPAGVIALIGLPFVMWAWARLLYRVSSYPFNTLFFLVGVGLFIFAWKTLLKYRRAWQWLMRAEHEATHLLFALLTGNGIMRWPASSSTEGNPERKSHRQILEGSNWLIDVSPYFFPTAAVVFWFVLLFVPFSSFGLVQLALGFATGFHVVSTYLEILADRDEIESLGKQFCYAFLPTANLFVLGILLSFTQSGISGMLQFFGELIHPFA